MKGKRDFIEPILQIQATHFDCYVAVSHSLDTPVFCPISKLPVEVFIAIAERTDQQTLCALFCVTNPHAYRAILRNITL